MTDPMDTVETVSVGVWVDVGARHEHSKINGVSHLLEHMAFKGTQRRSARAIAEEIEAAGGHLNAYTSRENTAYYAKVLKEDVGLAVDILADILQHSTMDPEELARERAVVIQEIHQAYDTPDDIIFDHFQSAAFPGQGLGMPVLGLAPLVDSMPRPEILDYMRRNYTAPRMVLAASGRIDHDRLVTLAEEAFGELKGEEAGSRDKAGYVGGDFRESRELEQVHLLVGLEGVAFGDDDFYCASVLSTLLGGGMSSRLFQEVREKRGLAYSIYTFLSSYTDAGLFGIYAGTGKEEVKELIPLICDEISKVCDRVSEEEVARARTQIKSGILMSRESTSSRCEQAAHQVLVFGRPLTTEEIVARIEEVDAARIQQTARRIFSSRPTMAAMGPVDAVMPFDGLAGKMSR